MEGKFKEAEGEATALFESLLPNIRKAFVDAYMRGFTRGLESAECGETALARLNDEYEAIANGAAPIDGEPRVRLKKDAILKRKLRRDEFPARVWRAFQELNIETLGDILEVSEAFYLNMPNFGMGSLNMIRLYVRKYGYKLREK